MWESAFNSTGNFDKIHSKNIKRNKSWNVSMATQNDIQIKQIRSAKKALKYEPEGV